MAEMAGKRKIKTFDQVSMVFILKTEKKVYYCDFIFEFIKNTM